MTKIVTYRYAYAEKTIDLCDDCTDGAPFALGPVTHGRRDGTCEVCGEESE